MAMHTFRDQAEKSTVRLGDVHADKIRFLAGETVELHKALPDMKTMKVNFNSSSLHIGKILIVASSFTTTITSFQMNTVTTFDGKLKRRRPQRIFSIRIIHT